ncbi:MAG: hypothetical protein ABIP39_08820 [Polyangiaceae bacterium]
MSARTALLAIATLSVLAACSRPQESERTPTPATTVTVSLAPTIAPPGLAVGELSWDAPATWPKVWSPSPMRKATYSIPKAEGDKDNGELTVTEVGGGLDANIERWAGQFGNAEIKRAEQTAGALKITTVEMHGTYHGGMPNGQGGEGPKEGYALLAAVVTDPKGTLTFFKLVGPAKTLSAAHPDFDKFVKTIHQN